MEQEPSPSFITSIIELKLDPTTMFEWQRHTQSQTEVPHYREMLEFLDRRAQASEILHPVKGNLIEKSGLHLCRLSKFKLSIHEWRYCDSKVCICYTCANSFYGTCTSIDVQQSNTE